MAKLMDLTNKRFGYITAIKLNGKNKYGQIMWLCKCDCGKETTVLTGNLRSNATKSCGCLKNKADKLINKRFGNLIVIAKERRNNKTLLLCRCACGKEVFIRHSHLISGNNKSCGCLQHFRLPKGEAALNRLLLSYKKGAQKRNYLWELTKEEFKHLTKQSCYYCGEKPSQVIEKSRYNGNYFYNGLDRVDNNKGYSVDNIVTCCFTCNMAKNSMTIQEFDIWIDTVYNRLKEGKRNYGILPPLSISK